MPEETKTKKEETSENEVVKAIREEYEKKIEELKVQHKEEIENVKKELEENHIKQIRALISGKEDYEEKKHEEQKRDKGFYETALEETLNKFNIKN